MSFVQINGWEIPIARESASQEAAPLGAIERSYSGAHLHRLREVGTKHSFTTVPMDIADARALAGLLNGQGDLWRFDIDNWSVKGTGTSSTTANMVVTPGKYGGGADIISPTAPTYHNRSMRKEEGSVGMWVLVNAALKDGTRRKLFWHATTNGFNRIQMEKNQNGQWLAVVGSNDVAGHHLWANDTITQDTWAHFCVTWSQRRIAFYINGDMVGENTAPVYLPSDVHSAFDLGHMGGIEHVGSRVDDLFVLPYAASDKMVSGIAKSGLWFAPIPKVFVKGSAFTLRNRYAIPEFTGMEWFDSKRATVSFNLYEDI